MPKIFITPLTKGADALPQSADLLQDDGKTITIRHKDIMGGKMYICTTKIPLSAVAYTTREPAVEDAAAPTVPVIEPKPKAKPEPAPVPPPVVARVAQPVQTEEAEPVQVPKKRGPKPKPRDANGNIIREPVTPTLAPPAETPAPPARPGAEIKKPRRKPEIEPDAAPEFVPTGVKPKPVSKYRPTVEVEEDSVADAVDDDDVEFDEGVDEPEDVVAESSDEEEDFDF